jgi:sulfite reductase (NADPH) flavoprotein alpha-component
MIISDTVGQKSSEKTKKTVTQNVTIKERYALTKTGSSKETYHISLDTKGVQLEYSVGDSIAVHAENDPLLVDQILTVLHAQGDELILNARTQELMKVRDFLRTRANLSRLTSSFLKLFLDYGKNDQLETLLEKENKPLLSNYLKMHDPLSFFRSFPEIRVPLQEICTQFGPLLPRFYSIASSQKWVQDELHLTVALSTFEISGEKRYGVASHFLCNLAEIQKTSIPIYVQHAHAFSLPSQEQTPIIMIGPGTGVAPFRGFVQERLALKHPGKNWLFFGERNRNTDYFYEEFWTSLLEKNALKLDLAFSRDQNEKCYVQHKMLENAQELWSWIQEGAHLYVCGDAERMAKEVDATLHRIVEEQGNLSPEDSKAFIKGLRTQKRYLLDVY